MYTLQGEQYEELGLIGSGAYGTVFKARDRNNDGQMVALKKVRVPMSETGVPISILREIALLKQLQTFDHPNVVKLVNDFQFGLHLVNFFSIATGFLTYVMVKTFPRKNNSFYFLCSSMSNKICAPTSTSVLRLA